MPIVRDFSLRWPQLQIDARAEALQRSWRLMPGRLDAPLAAQAGAALRAARRLWDRDASLWSGDPGVQAKVAQRLGWLSSPALMADAIERLRAFGDGVRRDGFTHAVLLGMGGSSLAPEVLRSVLGTGPGGLDLRMLDSTDPAAVLAVETPVPQTLYVLASKSGTTIEPNSLAAHFQQVLADAGIERWSNHFVAITDEGTELARRGRDEAFREVFINPSDIGGRYSALSYFGLVPAALMGHDLDALVGYALAYLSAAEPNDANADASGASALAAAMAVGARHGRDKLTLLLPTGLEAFGLWVEQLVAESTGKSGVGVVPVVGEMPGHAGVYGSDRAFVRVTLRGRATDPDLDALVATLAREGAPVAHIEMPEVTALGAEFVRWEIATALAGALLEINPFDEPNVSQAKDATRRLLAGVGPDGRLTMPAADVTSQEGITYTLTAAAKAERRRSDPEGFLSLVGPGDYVALLAYLGPDPALEDALESIRRRIRDHWRTATTFGYGPRYLHSSGQLHKGGPNTGVFIMVSAAPRIDVPIPGEIFTFGTLELAQAAGDFQSLNDTGRRAVHVHLPEPDPGLLAAALSPLLQGVTRA